MEMFIAGVTLGMVFGFIFCWRRICNLEDKLMEKEELLNAAVDIIREERKSNKEWQEVKGKCDGSGDLFKKW